MVVTGVREGRGVWEGSSGEGPTGQGKETEDSDINNR